MNDDNELAIHFMNDAQISLDGVSAAKSKPIATNLAASLTKRFVAETAKVLGQGIIAGANCQPH